MFLEPQDESKDLLSLDEILSLEGLRLRLVVDLLHQTLKGHCLGSTFTQHGFVGVALLLRSHLLLLGLGGKVFLRDFSESVFHLLHILLRVERLPDVCVLVLIERISEWVELRLVLALEF